MLAGFIERLEASISIDFWAEAFYCPAFPFCLFLFMVNSTETLPLRFIRSFLLKLFRSWKMEGSSLDSRMNTFVIALDFFEPPYRIGESGL